MAIFVVVGDGHVVVGGDCVVCGVYVFAVVVSGGFVGGVGVGGVGVALLLRA